MIDLKRIWSTENCAEQFDGGVGVNTNNCQCKGAIVPTALYGTDTGDMRSAERRNANVLEIKRLGSSVGVTRMDRVQEEKVREIADMDIKGAGY